MKFNNWFNRYEIDKAFPSIFDSRSFHVLWTILKKSKTNISIHSFFFDRYRTRIGEKKSFLIRLFIHEYVTSVQSVEPFYEFVPRLGLSFSWRNIHLGTQNTPLYYTSARSFLSRNFKCLLHLIIRHYAWSQTPRASSSSREIYRQLGHDVSARLSSNRSILKTNWLNAVWKSIARDTSRISFSLFFFFFKFYIGKFYISLCFLSGKIDLWNVRRMYIAVL